MASAHVTANPATAPAGGYGRVDFRVPHGCEGEATNVVEIKIPTGVVSLKPLAKSGWKVETETVETEAYQLHGQTLTSQIGVVRWSGGSLSDSEFDDFAISAKFPDQAGQTLYFPTIQYCENGTAEWLDIPGADGKEPEHPAPAVLLVPDKGHAPSSDDAQAVSKQITEMEGKINELSKDKLSSTDDEDGGSNALSAAALITGLTAAGLSGVALSRKR